MTELITSFPLDKQPSILDLMQQAERVKGLKNINLGATRQMQDEDSNSARLANLAKLRSAFTNPQTGQVDRANYQGALNMSGYGPEADADQAGQYEMQQKKLESTVKAIDFSSRILGAAADHPEYRKHAVDMVYQISESIGGKKPDITADDPPAKFKYFAAQGLSYKDKLQLQADEAKQRQLQYNQDANRSLQMRGQDQRDLSSNWVQTMGANGVPEWTQRTEGTRVFNEPKGAGGALGKAKSPQQRLADQQEMIDLVTQAKAIIPKATGSGLGSQFDEAGRFFGHTSESATATKRLQVISANMIQKMPRPPGAQSDADLKQLINAAGNIADANVPTEEKMAALEEIKTIYKRQLQRQMEYEQSGGISTEETTSDIQPIEAINPTTGEEIRSFDGGKTWQK